MMKKALSKPISSPNRADNFPPPLMRFLRSNVGSKSRGKSKSQRSTSIFYTRGKRNSAKVIETTQEPSSPKVTCIGQVRASRTAKSASRKRGSASVKIRRCWFGENLFRSRKLAFREFFRRFLRYCYCNRVDATEDSIRVYSEKSENTENGDGDREIKNTFDVNSFSSPPKNALILTRCRSAPYKSSSLGGLFWGSSLPENDAKSDELENLGENVEDLKGIGGGAIHPLVLTRCKSEPARTGERLNPEGNLWRRRRLGDF
ncbi:hypothetical protein DH2020_040075 [Rehmannia glutinosa]|uniref:Uncharacterized protein n=1 Tax=Rehmannia glutinosa TaxID=99300 RepID=A0ABR0UV83_REHGL